MCLIVDINVAEAVFLRNDDPNFREVHKLLFTRTSQPVHLVYGGKLTEEYMKNRDVFRLLRVLDQAGRTRTVSNKLIEAECAVLSKLASCKSNDTHILALARVGKVRLLCSNDQALRDDFRNKTILDSPRGKVYSNPSHNRLLTQFCKAGISV